MYIEESLKQVKYPCFRDFFFTLIEKNTKEISDISTFVFMFSLAKPYVFHSASIGFRTGKLRDAEWKT